MTIAAAWVRKVHHCEELVFISDSRLCGGLRWDECPKLMTFFREDCAIAFSGDTGYAYPMMMQLNNSMAQFNRIMTRAMDIVDLNGHLIKHIDHLMNAVNDLPDPNDFKENEFIFGGYSWSQKQFRLWRYYFKKSEHKFTKEGKLKSIFPGIKSKMVIIGDQRENYKKRLRAMLLQKYGDSVKNKDESLFLDMEPFETLCNMLREVTPEMTIGGAPQMIKVYQYMNSRPVGIYWPFKSENAFANRTMLGRKLFEYEDSDFWFMDPDKLIANPCHKEISPQ